MFRVETTPGCPRTPRILMALEELGADYAIEMRDPGFFNKTYNLQGPCFEEGTLVIFEPNAVLRHLMRAHAPSGFAPHDPGEWAVADQWMDFAIAALAPAASRIALHRRNVPRERQDRQMMEVESHALLRALAALDAFLEPRPYVLGRFTLVDCVFTLLDLLPATEIPTDHFSAVQDYVLRLLCRPAWMRATAKLRAAAL
jgi:glutathione S-transferase